MPQDESLAVPQASENPHLGGLFAAVKNCYERQQFCDVTIHAKEEDHVLLRKVQCHSIVLCSVFPALKELLLEQEEEREDRF